MRLGFRGPYTQFAGWGLGFGLQFSVHDAGSLLAQFSGLRVLGFVGFRVYRV